MSSFPVLDQTYPRQSRSPPKTHNPLTLSIQSSHNPATMRLSIFFHSTVTLFIASAMARKHCTTTSTVSTTCFHGGPTATVYGSVTETATSSVDCHGCQTLAYTTPGQVCPVSDPAGKTAPSVHPIAAKTDVLIATIIAVYHRTHNHRHRSHFRDYHHRLQQDPVLNSKTT